MKKILSLFALLLTIVIGAKAQATPDYESYDWESSEEIDDALGTHGDVTVSVVTGGSDGNVSGHYYRPLNGAVDGSSETFGTYFGVSSTKQIDKIEVFFCPNGTSNTNLAWVGWGEGVTPNEEVGSNYGSTADYKATKSWDDATWQTIDLSDKEIYTIYMSRQIKNFKKNGSKISNTGDNQTVNLLGFKVYLVGEKYAVTYNLGDAVSGTAPTQADVAEGKTFTVAVAPSDLVAPEGKEFKCWNDGTNDYYGGDTYTVGTSNVTLTAQFQDESTKYSITYTAGEGTGDDIDGGSYSEDQHVTLADYSFTEPDSKRFIGWLCNVDNTVYNVGDTYIMTAEATTFTAQYQKYSRNVIYSLTDNVGSASVEAADATVNEGVSLVLSNTDGRIKISAADGKTFKAGDVITFTGTVGNQSKNFGIKYGATTKLGTNLYKSDAVGDGTVKGTLTLSEDATDIYIGRYDGTTTTLTSLVISRSVDVVTITPAKQYTTFSSTKALNFSAVEGLEAYAAVSAADGKVVMTKVTDIPANTGLVLKETGSAESYDVPEGTATSLDVDNKLVAATTATEVEAYNGTTVFNYILKDGEFHPATAGTLAAGKAYLSLDASAGQQGLVMEFDDAPTAVEAVQDVQEFKSSKVQKVIKNGQLFIGNYNVAGARVK